MFTGSVHIIFTDGFYAVSNFTACLGLARNPVLDGKRNGSAFASFVRSQCGLAVRHACSERQPKVVKNMHLLRNNNAFLHRIWPGLQVIFQNQLQFFCLSFTVSI